MGRFAALVALSGCQVIFPLDERLDGSSLPCEHGTPFGAGMPVAIDGTFSVEGARFDPEQTVAYLSLCPTTGTVQENKQGCDLYQSPFIRATREFSLVSRLGLSATGEYDAYPTITPDLGYILFGSERQSGPHVFIAPKVNGGFDSSPVTEVAVGKQFSNEPYVVGDGSILYVSGSDDSLDWDLYRATGTPPDYQGFSVIAGVSTGSGEFAPVVTEDELELFFASDREATGTDFTLDIFTATRASTAAPFGPASKVTTLSTSGIDWPLWISPDRCDLYYINKPTTIGTLMVTSRR